jgi:uncharacterized protein YjbJ (UPF0337 family)
MTDGPSNLDDAKGRLKESAGDLTGNEDMKRDGQTDQAAGKVKEGVDKVTDKVKDVLDRDRD